MTFNFPQKINLARLPTPLQPLHRISAVLGGPKLFLKRDDLTEFGAGGNKVRKLEFVLAEALRQGAGGIITCGGVQSNHCRATAILCARLGLSCHLILRGETPTQLQANTLLGSLCGATVSFHKLSEYKNLDKLFEHYSNVFTNRGIKPYCVPTGASDEVGLWGYISAAEEILSDLKSHNIAPSTTLVCCATGSGGTHAGLALAMDQLKGTRVKAFAVCDDAEYFQQKATQDITAWQGRHNQSVEFNPQCLDICDEFIGPGYAKPYPELLETLSWAAATEGVLLDPVYTGKAFHGMVEQIKRGLLSEFENIIFVHTGGVFGLFPYQELLQPTSLGDE